MALRLYAVSLQARRGFAEDRIRRELYRELGELAYVLGYTEYVFAHLSTSLFAASETEARERATELVEGIFSKEEGWGSHSVSVAKVPPGMVVDAARAI